MTQDTLTKSVIILMALGISALFLAMIQPFLMTLLLAGIFSALARPLYLRLQARLSCSAPVASLLTLLLIAVMVLIPAIFLITVLIGQALDVSELITIWVRGVIEDPTDFMAVLQHLPFYDEVILHRGLILEQAGQVATIISKLLVDWVSSATLKTANFIFLTFVLLYSLFFLLMDGPKLILKLLYYLPLQTRDERLLLDKFTSVTRATLKGSLFIGLLQGSLAGIAFAVAGIDNAVFWGTVMALLSIIPNVGAALVWIPAVIILIFQGAVLTGVLLGLFCGLIVGSLDNLLRPILVGKDTKMHELMIFFSTLGGLFMFGLPGLFIGPVIASLLISIWEIYGVEFADVLPEVGELLVEQVTQGTLDAPEEHDTQPSDSALDLEASSESSSNPEQASNQSGKEQKQHC
ncbi:AI-2E family transporter [Allochromatium palmeri]|uniref:AI-2E family transporter n=1 Tax=Allochromatium palmeri TaxID=231048 RepID=A0A6N8EG20_9GAMM|nr:AI-2E family transporter [Allochromatium palmeri]MTW21606.1 AI-2E family transporter [Allochromatium palmeri]